MVHLTYRSLIGKLFDISNGHWRMLNVVVGTLIDADRQEQIPDIRSVVFHSCGPGSLLFSGLSAQTVGTVISPVHLE